MQYGHVLKHFRPKISFKRYQNFSKFFFILKSSIGSDAKLEDKWPIILNLSTNQMQLKIFINSL